MSTTFVFRALDSSGVPQSGELAADSRAAVAQQLRQRGLIVVDVEEKIAPPTVEDLFDRFRKVKAREITVFSRQLATMVASGLSLLRALYILEDQTPDRKLKSIVIKVREDVEGGLPLSRAMERHPRAFSTLFTSMVRAGEAGGALEETLERAAIQMEKDDNLKRTVKSAMVYPILIAVFAVVVLICMLLFLIPIFDKMYSDLGGELPALTQLMIDLSAAMRSRWYVAIAVPIGIVVALKKWKASYAGRRQWDGIKLKLPVRIGEIVNKIVVARFARTLSTLTASGVPILQALEITGETAGNRHVQDPMEEVINRVRQGSPLAPPLSRIPVFPAMLVQMVAVGEETGALDRMLGKLADFYEDEVATLIKALTSILEPIMMIVVGAIVGVVVLAMYMPLFKVFEVVQKAGAA